MTILLIICVLFVTLVKFRELQYERESYRLTKWLNRRAKISEMKVRSGRYLKRIR